MIGKKSKDRDYNRRRGSFRRLALWCSVGIVAVITGSLLTAVLYMKHQGGSLIEFCNESLLGESSKRVVAAGSKFEFEMLERQDLLILTMPGRRHGRTCFVSISDGIVSDVNSVFVP